MNHLSGSAIRLRALLTDKQQLLDLAGVPRDPRGIVLGCGFAGAAGVGLVAILNDDLIGWAYLVVALIGYLFLQTRLIPVSVWLLVAAGGIWGTWAGASGAMVEAGFGLILVLVAVQPVADEWGPEEDTKPQPNLSQTSSVAEESSPAPVISISSIGRFQAQIGERDVTSRILDKRTIGGLWCYLLAIAARTPGGSISRAMLATQLSPGLARKQQRERFRRQLWDLQHDLGSELATLVVTDRSSIRLDVARANFDVALLQQLRSELEANLDSPIDANLLIQARRALDATADQVFLPDFERLAADAGIEPVVAKRTVLEARSHVNFLRAELARLLSEQRVKARPQKGDLS